MPVWAGVGQDHAGRFPGGRTVDETQVWVQLGARKRHPDSRIAWSGVVPRRWKHVDRTGPIPSVGIPGPSEDQLVGVWHRLGRRCREEDTRTLATNDVAPEAGVAA